MPALTGFSLRQISFCILNSAFASRPGQFIQDFLADHFAGLFPGSGFAVDAHAWRSLIYSATVII
jgi:hypothetical protein